MFPIKYRGLVECEYRDGYWRDQHFNCFPLMVKPNPGPFMSDSAFYLLKRILQTVPIVANVQIFIMPGAADHLWAKIIGSDSRIDLPPKQAIKKGNHAICLYGYDNSRQAFKFKNSWWVDDEEKIEAILKTPFIKWPKQWPKKPWGDDGSAWISYEYIRQHIVDAMVILPHPTEMWIDPDTSAKPQPNDKVVTAKFEEMLAAYKARRSSR
jgi:hypothetical protein